MRRLTFGSPQPGTRPPPTAREMTRGSLPAGERAASGLQPRVFRDVRHPRPLGLTTADAAAPEYVDGRCLCVTGTSTRWLTGHGVRASLPGESRTRAG